MLFVIARLFDMLVRPDTVLVAALVLGVLLFAFGLRRSGGTIVVAVTVLFVAATVLPFGEWAAEPLEQRFPEPALPARIDGIILLGGAVDLRLTEAHGKVAITQAAGRITDAVALAVRYPGVPVVISGGDPSIFAPGIAEATVTRTLLIALGLDDRRIVVEDRSRNTVENAIYSKELVKPQPGQVWVLVTSAMDIPRAVGCFRRVGWDVLPYPADYHAMPGDGLSLSLAGDLTKLEWAMHEWIGLVVYRVLGRTDALFPGPG